MIERPLSRCRTLFSWPKTCWKYAANSNPEFENVGFAETRAIDKHSQNKSSNRQSIIGCDHQLSHKEICLLLSIGNLKTKTNSILFTKSDTGQLRVNGFDYQFHESNACNKWLKHKSKFDISSNEHKATIDEIENSIQKNLYFVTIQFEPKYIPSNFDI